MSIPFIRSGDYFIPDLKLTEETRPIGKWDRMRREYLKEHHPIQYTNLIKNSPVALPKGAAGKFILFSDYTPAGLSLYLCEKWRSEKKRI